MSRQNFPAAQRRDMTVETVVDLAATNNPAEITTGQIAQHMGVSQGALFRHFPTKDAVWGAVIVWTADQLNQRLDRALEKEASPLSALEAMFMAHVEFVAARPGVPRIMFGELQRAGDTAAKRGARALMDGYRTRVMGLVERGKTDGALPGDMDAEAAAILFVGTIQGLVMQAMISGDFTAMQSTASRVFKIYLRGIGARK
jgi:TetR/AcrR family transcriptional regulator